MDRVSNTFVMELTRHKTDWSKVFDSKKLKNFFESLVTFNILTTMIIVMLTTLMQWNPTELYYYFYCGSVIFGYLASTIAIFLIREPRKITVNVFIFCCILAFGSSMTVFVLGLIKVILYVTIFVGSPAYNADCSQMNNYTTGGVQMEILQSDPSDLDGETLYELCLKGKLMTNTIIVLFFLVFVSTIHSFLIGQGISCVWRAMKCRKSDKFMATARTLPPDSLDALHNNELSLLPSHNEMLVSPIQPIGESPFFFGANITPPPPYRETMNSDGADETT